MNGTSKLSHDRPAESPEHSSLLAAPYGLLAPEGRAMAEPVMTVRRGAVPRQGPASAGSPVERLVTAPAVSAARRRVLIRTYPGTTEQIRLVRAALAPLLAGCPAGDDALLIGSELAANAAVHSNSGAPGGQFTVRADVRPGDYVWIEVEDQGGAWAGGHDDERPHGLDLVHLLAGNGNWGIDGNDQSRTVWVLLDWPLSHMRET